MHCMMDCHTNRKWASLVINNKIRETSSLDFFFCFEILKRPPRPPQMVQEFLLFMIQFLAISLRFASYCTFISFNE